MAQIKLGAGIADMRGSIGGVVFSRNRSGAYARNRTIPVNPGSALQLEVRAAIGQVRAAWFEDLSTSARAAWKTYADNVPVINRLGEQIHLTGWNMFARTNTFQVYHGKPIITAAPTDFSTAEMDGNFAAVGADDGTITLTIDNTLGWANEAGGRMEVYVSAPQNGTKNFYKGPYNKVSTILGATPVPPVVSQTFAMPQAVVIGQRVFLMARIFRADGRLSQIFRTVGNIES